MLVFFYTHKKYYVIHAKITSIFTIQKLLCIARTQKLPYKNYHTFFPIQKLLCSAHTKITIHFYYVFFPYKNLLCITRKKSHTKNVSVFPTQKLLCSAHIQKLPYKNY